MQNSAAGQTEPVDWYKHYGVGSTLASHPASSHPDYIRLNPPNPGTHPWYRKFGSSRVRRSTSKSTTTTSSSPSACTSSSPSACTRDLTNKTFMRRNEGNSSFDKIKVLGLARGDQDLGASGTSWRVRMCTFWEPSQTCNSVWEGNLHVGSFTAVMTDEQLSKLTQI